MARRTKMTRGCTHTPLVTYLPSVGHSKGHLKVRWILSHGGLIGCDAGAGQNMELICEQSDRVGGAGIVRKMTESGMYRVGLPGEAKRRRLGERRFAAATPQTDARHYLHTFPTCWKGGSLYPLACLNCVHYSLAPLAEAYALRRVPFCILLPEPKQKPRGCPRPIFSSLAESNIMGSKS
ncbi:hypothetical protein K469DRAFT_155611 [Zopfia rhizophila CBS 207.26]|uniref:Uncharacterized protein n=1 Tax=Zopfia rhizophila CBS 207.26 TaxID=1314779 RepID=A0A6A6E3Z5_9PEZI|nr:hypothetical protein K469DRAFT_155611 [Zopfia rhizophila CBS 207.26]